MAQLLKNEKIDWQLLELGGLKSKNDPPGHTGVLLVAMPRRQYVLFIVVGKLSVVERRATRRLKTNITTHLTHD